MTTADTFTQSQYGCNLSEGVITGHKRQSHRQILIMAASILSMLLALTGCSANAKPSVAPSRSAPDEGKALYATYCFQCHGGETGGKLRDIPPPHNANGHTWHHPDQQLTQIILEGLSFSAPDQPKMPAFRDRLTVEQVQAILAYIKTWWTPEQRSTQATVTASTAELEKK